MILRAVLAILWTALLGLLVTLTFGWGWWAPLAIVVAAVVGARWAVPGDTP